MNESIAQFKRVKKTAAMLEIEQNAGTGEDIRQIILDLLRKHAFNADAAAELGISESALSTWIHRLGIYDEAYQIRRDRFAEGAASG